MHYDLIPVLPHFIEFKLLATAECFRARLRRGTTTEVLLVIEGHRQPLHPGRLRAQNQVARALPGTLALRSVRCCCALLGAVSGMALTWMLLKLFFATHVHCNHAKTPCTLNEYYYC